MAEFREIPLMLFAYVALFLPIAIYCLVLALVNRRINPLMVSGVWDATGLLLACSGGLLVCGPSIVYVNFSRISKFQALEPDEEVKPDAKEPPKKELNQQGDPRPSMIGLWWWFVWGGYNLIVLAGAVLLVRGRRDRTFIYNCDPDLFGQLLSRTLGKCHLAHVRVGRKVFIGPREIAAEQEAPNSDLGEVGGETHIRAGAPLPAMSIPEEGRLGEVNVLPFPATCHVTLHWKTESPSLREEVEDELRRNLDECRCLENPAAGWFLSISSILFFFSVAVVVFFILVLFGPRR